MSSTYKVDSVRDGKIKDNPHKKDGKLQAFYVDFRDSEGSGQHGVFWQREPQNKPEVGQEFFGDITEGEFGLRFKQAQNPNGSTGTASTNEAPEDRQASIIRQTVLKVFSPSINAEESLTPALRKRIEEVEQFVREASQSAPKPSSAPGHPPEGHSPTGSPQSTTPDDSAEHIDHLLEVAGCNSAATLIVRGWMLTKLDTERRDKAIKGLEQDPPNQAVLAQLKTLAEKDFGEPLPTDQPDFDSLPF